MVLDESEVRTAVARKGSSDAEVLAAMNVAVSRRLDRLCGPIVQRTVEAERHRRACTAIWLRHGPASIDTIVVTPDQPWDPTPWSPDPALALSIEGAFGDVTIDYTAGRYDTTATVDGRFKEAARLMLRNLWRSETQAVVQVGEYDVPSINFPTYAVPHAVRDLLRDDIVEIPGVA
ncbi:MAG: hypothetical protein ACXIVQ_12235 [Acidimicrobiales bacterium]